MMKVSNFTAWLNEQLMNGSIDNDQMQKIQTELKNAPNNALNETVVSLYLRVNELEKDVKQLKNSLKRDDGINNDMDYF